MKCRLHCSYEVGRTPIRARVLDVSEGGLCLLSPIALQREQTYVLRIDVPPTLTVVVEATAWHVRRVESQATGRNFWCVGMMLVKADDGYLRLLPEAPERVELPGDGGEGADEEGEEDSVELSTFRVRVRARVGPRSRVLTLSAVSEAQARELAVADLDGDWIVVEVRAA